MTETTYNKTRKATFNLTIHIVLVTKYRRKVLTDSMLKSLEQYFLAILEAWDCEMVEFNGESDHVHLLIKSSSCKNLWRDYPMLKKTYWGKKVLWTPSYFVASCGGVTIETLEKYIQTQDRPG
jgi:putative transposase